MQYSVSFRQLELFRLRARLLLWLLLYAAVVVAVVVDAVVVVVFFFIFVGFLILFVVVAVMVRVCIVLQSMYKLCSLFLAKIHLISFPHRNSFSSLSDMIEHVQ